MAAIQLHRKTDLNVRRATENADTLMMQHNYTHRSQLHREAEELSPNSRLALVFKTD
jgi:hypothetical protein